MLGFFPKLGPDELLYSGIARYGAMLPRRSASTLIGEFFGTTVGIAAMDLPRRLDDLAARLPSRKAEDVDRLVRDHTLHPYMVRFAPARVREAVRQSMAGDDGRIAVRLGVMATAFRAREWLALCPDCAKVDTDASGASKWRRVHQLLGVFICPDHGRWLLESAVHRIHRRGRAAFTPLTLEMLPGGKPFDVPRRLRSDLAKRYAERSLSLLTRRDATDPADVQRRLRDLLFAYRWTKAPSLLRSTELARDFLRHPHVAPMLEASGVRWSEGQAATALNRLLYAGETTKHPLLVLMALEVAGATLEDLFAPSPAIVPVARASVAVRTSSVNSLPCGNPVCGRWMGPIRGTASTNGSPIKASCGDCGFVYALDARRPGVIAVLATGPTWDRALVEMLADKKASLRKVAAALDVAPTTAMRHARRLGSWRSEWRERPKVARLGDSRTERLLQKHRAAWLQSGCPLGRVPVKAIGKPAFNAYRYLARHDRAWMDGVSGPTHQARATEDREGN